MNLHKIVHLTFRGIAQFSSTARLFGTRYFATRSKHESAGEPANSYPHVDQRKITGTVNEKRDSRSIVCDDFSIHKGQLDLFCVARSGGNS